MWCSECSGFIFLMPMTHQRFSTEKHFEQQPKNLQKVMCPIEVLIACLKLPLKKEISNRFLLPIFPGVSVFRWVSDFFSRKSLKGDFSILVVGSRNGGLESGSHGESFANAVHPGFGILTSIGIRLRKVTIWRANLLIQVLKGSPTILRGWGLRSYAATTAS